MTSIKLQAKNLIKKLDIYSPYPLFYKFRMTKNEQRVFNNHVTNSKYYLEFGSGGSTLRALQKSKAKIYSVESSKEWIDYLSKHLIIRLARNERLFFHHVNVGQTESWGHPTSKNSNKLFPNYSNSIFDIIEPKKVDTVLIDGRFRVACTLNVILNLSLNDNIIILIHDFWNREKYQIVLKYLDVVEKVDLLGVFKIKNNVDSNLVRQDYDIYKYIPD